MAQIGTSSRNKNITSLFRFHAVGPAQLNRSSTKLENEGRIALILPFVITATYAGTPIPLKMLKSKKGLNQS
jgi:hypothetical protein